MPSPAVGFVQLVAAVAVAVASFFACNEFLGNTGPTSERIFTPSELAKYNGTAGGGGRFYLAVLGSVYDVTAGSYYQPGGGYEFFSGRDASRAFVSGNFSGDGLTDDLEGLSPSQYAGVAGWKKFYDDAENYFFVGKLIGRFYTADGEPTAELTKVDDMVAAADALKEAKKSDENTFKTCNSKWKKDTGTEVYCKDGLLPRRLVRPDHEIEELRRERCTCARPSQIKKHMETILFLFDDCAPDAASCKKTPKEKKAA